jgi:hypothetical protein
MTFRGVWLSDQTYTRGNVLTHAGSLWCAIDESRGEVPGKSPNFKLVAKAGSAP